MKEYTLKELRARKKLPNSVKKVLTLTELYNILKKITEYGKKYGGEI